MSVFILNITFLNDVLMVPNNPELHIFTFFWRSHLSNWSDVGSEWVLELVDSSSGRQISDGSWGSVELVQSALQVSLEGVGLLVSDPALVVLVEVVPGGLEVGVQEGWHLVWSQLVGSLEDGSSGESGLVLHEELLAGLVTRGGSSLLGESGEDVVHDLILVGSVESGDSHVLPGGWVNVSSELIGVIMNLEGLSSSQEGSDGDDFSIHN